MVSGLGGCDARQDWSQLSMVQTGSGYSVNGIHFDYTIIVNGLELNLIH